SLALELPSAKGDALWWHADVVVSRRSHPDAARALGDATLIMKPKRPRDPRTTALLLELYGDEIAARFEEVAASRDWVLLRRRR
ncbi:MAG TPA: hypothetical protein VHF22_00855, partial [Planctomycetota bacterium]|nr:hypothetical protein [Planctomycetota bacterium]